MTTISHLPLAADGEHPVSLVIETASPPPPRLPHHTQITWTKSEWKHAGFPLAYYPMVSDIAQRTFEYHAGSATLREQYEPPAAIINPVLQANLITPALTTLKKVLTKDVDPALDDAEALFAEARGAIAETTATPPDVQGDPEQRRLSHAAGTVRVDSLQTVVDADMRAGFTHHRRSSRWLILLVNILPWIEATGTFTFLAYWMNINLLDPLPHITEILLAAIVAGGVVGLQTVAVHKAAAHHNDGRAAAVDGRRDNAVKHRRARNGYLVAAGLCATLIAAGLVLRMLSTAFTANAGVQFFLYGFAVVAAFAMPTLAFWVKATDGSPISREKEALETQVSAAKDHDRALLDNATNDVVAGATILRRVMDGIIPQAVADFQTDLIEVNELYTLSRGQIGGLKELNIEAPRIVRRVDAGSGAITGAYVRLDIPGLQPVPIEGLPVRLSRLQGLVEDAVTLAELLGGAPAKADPMLTRQSASQRMDAIAAGSARVTQHHNN